jgi:voltage-gated potassium channel
MDRPRTTTAQRSTRSTRRGPLICEAVVVPFDPGERVGPGDPVRRWGGVRRLEMAKRERRKVVIFSLSRAVVGAVLIVVAYYTLPLAAGSAGEIVIRVVISVVAIGTVVLWQVRAISTSKYPWLRSVEALAFAVALMVMCFATVYLSMSQRDPLGFSEPLSRTDALYFTMTTLATIGFVDISATSETARVAVMIQIVFNVAVIGVSVRLILATARHRASTERYDEADGVD